MIIVAFSIIISIHLLCPLTSLPSSLSDVCAANVSLFFVFFYTSISRPFHLPPVPPLFLWPLPTSSGLLNATRLLPVHHLIALRRLRLPTPLLTTFFHHFELIRTHNRIFIQCVFCEVLSLGHNRIAPKNEAIQCQIRRSLCEFPFFSGDVPVTVPEETKGVGYLRART